MIPLRDLNPTRRTPFLTYALIAINVLVFLWEQSFSSDELVQVLQRISVVPVLAAPSPLGLPTLLDVLRSMFLHGGWAHLLGNMLYLYLFGDNVEDRLGHLLFLLLYLAAGYIAAMAQVAMDPSSEIPLIGASGAIAGVLGSYLVFFPAVRVRGIIPLGFFGWAAEWPAWAVLLLWFGLQLFNGFASLGVPAGGQGGVAFFAHIAGFAFGAVITFLLMAVLPQPPTEDRYQMLYDRANRYRF